MWVVTHQKKDVKFNLLVGEEYAVGRKDTSILIDKDPSISRKHAVFSVAHSLENLSNPSKLPILKIRDAGSKYGTFRNGTAVSVEGEALNDKDTIKFGQFESVFRVSYSPLVITTSCIETSKKKELKKLVQQLGGHFVQEWRPSCTHLIMTDIKITIKAVCSLISQKPLVLPEYLIHLSRHISLKSPEPSVTEFIPPISEPSIDKEKACFDVVPERKVIFKNKKFIFLDRNQFKKLYFSITIGGGEALHINQPVEDMHNFLLQPGTCIIQPQVEDFKPSQCDPFVREIYDILYRNKKRMIPESDFGRAVVYCSTEIFCNPDVDIASTSMCSFKLYSQSLTQRDVYSLDSLSENISSKETVDKREKGKSLINEMDTLEVTNQAALNKKRKSVGQERNSASDLNNCDGPMTKVRKMNDICQTNTSSNGNSSRKSGLENSIAMPMSLAHVKVEPTCVMEVDTENDYEMAGTCVSLNSPAVPTVIDVASPKHNLLLNSKTKEKAINQNEKAPVVLHGSDQDQSGFLCSRNVTLESRLSDVLEEDIPRNLIKVKYVDLVCNHRPRRFQNCSLQDKFCSSLKNFKRFRKVIPVNARILPQIIGGHELQPYTKQYDKSSIFRDFDMKNVADILDDCEDMEEEKSRGEFDWESQK